MLGAALALGLGIYLGVAGNLSPWFWLGAFSLAVLAWLVFPCCRRKGSLVMACVLLILIGSFLAAFSRDRINRVQTRMAPLNGRALAICGQVMDEARWSRWGWQIPLRVERIQGEKVRPFKSEWVLPLSETPPVPGMIVKIKGCWRPKALERLPSRREREGLCGRVQAKYWREAGRQRTLQGFLYDIKTHLMQSGQQTLTRQSAEVLHGMAFNEPITDTELLDSFRAIGIVHILSVGGLHIGFLALLLAGLGAALRLPKKVIYFGTLAILPFFILMVGAEPPAVRAGIMSALVIIGFLGEKRVDGLNIWGAAALFILIIKPLDLFDIGFQLSFGASAGILWLFPIWRRAFPPHWRPWTDSTILSLAAQVGIIPLLALYFGTFPWVGIIANLVIIPFSTIAVQLGLAAEFLGMIWGPLAVPIQIVNEYVLQWMIGIIRWFASWSTPISLPLFNGWDVLLYYLSILAMGKMREVNPITRRFRIPQWVQLLIVIGALSAVTGWALAQAPPNYLRVEVIDVGQGDAILLTAPGGKRMLVDGGPGESYQSSLRPFLRRRMINRLDMVVLTHAHEDHVGGLTKLLEQRQVAIGEVFDPGIPHTSRVYERFLAQLLRRKIPYHKAHRGMCFKLGQQVDAEIIWPPARRTDTDDLNPYSIVMRIQYGDTRLLLMGDADQAAEQRLCALEGERLRAHILKVGHHGSAYSSSRRFLQLVRPNIAAISVGKGNGFGHPSREALKRLRQTKAVIYRTDRGGTVIIDFINRSQVKIRRESR